MLPPFSLLFFVIIATSTDTPNPPADRPPYAGGVPSLGIVPTFPIRVRRTSASASTLASTSFDRAFFAASVVGSGFLVFKW